MPEGVLLAIAAAIGGAITKTIEVIRARRNETNEAEFDITDEYQEDLENLRERINNYDEELDLWKTKYFDMLRERNSLRIRVMRMQRIREEES